MTTEKSPRQRRQARSQHVLPTRAVITDRGDTLIEVLIAVVIISLAAVALLGTLTTSLAASGEHRSLSVDDNLLKSLAESAKQSVELDPSSPQFSVCATSYTVPFTIPASDSGYTIPGYSSNGSTGSVTITSGALSNGLHGIEYSQGATTSRATFGTTCSGTAPDKDIQLLNLEVTAPNHVTQFLSVMVRNPSYAP